MEKRDVRSEIIRIGTRLISHLGYNATGIDAVLKEAVVPKGSFYHYFSSKEEFGMAVIDSFAETMERRLDLFLNDEEVPPLHRLRLFLENSLARINEAACSRGCLAGNLAQEMAGVNERFQIRLAEIFAMWRERFSLCLRQAQEAGELAPELDTELLADFIISGYEGAIIRTKVMRSPQPAKDFIDVVFTSLLRRG